MISGLLIGAHELRFFLAAAPRHPHKVVDAALKRAVGNRLVNDRRPLPPTSPRLRISHSCSDIVQPARVGWRIGLVSFGHTTSIIGFKVRRG